MDGEIVNCDSVQVYQRIQIATAKVSPEERRGIPHHLIDFVPPEVNFTAGDWARVAGDTIREIEARGKAAILAGGTGLYLRSLRQPFFASPATNIELRRRLSARRETKGADYLHRMLARMDPAEAEKLNPRDWPRVQRALEVCLQTGKPVSAQRPERPTPPELAGRLRILALNPPRQELYDRINQRTEQHFASGLVAEVQTLLDEGVPPESNALGAHGYRRVVEFLRGQRDLPSAIEETKLNVRHYAKRQLTWFRHEPGVEWIEGFGDDPAVQKRVIEILGG
ncbi:MAG: tRNA dimethylallyltransferase [Blastocatellia bacterium]|nr:tRNA dimethylallyltransferase [Blastocatellia bacterium]